jgi:tetratricopeptide (TPR) repeat protein
MNQLPTLMIKVRLQRASLRLPSWRPSVFDSTRTMRHLPFFTELAALDDADSAWRAVSAGLVVLRLVDSWVEEGSAVVAADGWGVRSVRAAVEEMPAGLPARAILTSIVDALVESRGGDMHAVAPRLMAYARSLDLDAKWAMAADVYETLIAHVHPSEDSDVAVNAHLRRGHCLRQIGSFTEATTAFATAAELADSCGDMMGMLRARIGEAKIVVARGNLPAAEAMLDETIAQATAHELPEVRSLATHDRAYIAHTRGQYDVAVRFAYDAMHDSVSPSERDRILNDLAGSFYMLGVKSAARDAFLILATTAREQYQRWAATINLMELAAEDGIELQFGRYRQQLAGAALPPMLRAQFELHVGRGYQQFGDFGTARVWLERALDTAAAHSLNHLVFAVEAALDSNMPLPSAEPTPPFSFDIPRDVEHIAARLKEMRRTAGILIGS